MLKPIVTLALSLLAAAPPAGQTWPAFRGTGQGRTPARNLPLRWSDTENVAWKVELPGVGQSSPVIWGDRVFVTSVQGEFKEKLLVSCLDLATGKLLWTHEAPASQKIQVSDYVSKAAPTPLVDAGRVYAFFESGDLLALDHSGKALWQRSLSKEYGEIRGNHGLGGSPAQTADALFILVAHDGDPYLLSLEKETGKNRWKRDHPFSTSWSTPLVVERNGKTSLLVNSSGKLEEFDAATGEPVWVVDGLKGNTVASPTVEGNLAVLGSSERGNSLAVRLGGKGNVTGSHVAWRAATETCSFGSPAIEGKTVYLVNKTGVLQALDLETGALRWDTRLTASCWASPIVSGDRVYFFATDGGATVLKTGPTLQKLAENRLAVTGRVYGVAAVDGALVLRTDSALIRIGK